MTDLTNAEALITAHGSRLRYDVDAGKWLVWTGKLWRHDSMGEVDRLAREVVRSMYDLLKDAKTQSEREALYRHITKSESSPRLAAMADLARYCPGVPVQSKDLDSDPMLLNCENGTVDLRTGQLRAHRQADLITKLAPVEYDSKAEAPRWTRFLAEVFQQDAELIADPAVLVPLAVSRIGYRDRDSLRDLAVRLHISDQLLRRYWRPTVTLQPLC